MFFRLNFAQILLLRTFVAVNQWVMNASNSRFFLDILTICVYCIIVHIYIYMCIRINLHGPNIKYLLKGLEETPGSPAVWLEKNTKKNLKPVYEARFTPDILKFLQVQVQSYVFKHLTCLETKDLEIITDSTMESWVTYKIYWRHMYIIHHMYKLRLYIADVYAVPKAQQQELCLDTAPMLLDVVWQGTKCFKTMRKRDKPDSNCSCACGAFSENCKQKQQNHGELMVFLGLVVFWNPIGFHLSAQTTGDPQLGWTHSPATRNFKWHPLSPGVLWGTFWSSKN